jgi:hypothetical protein
VTSQLRVKLCGFIEQCCKSTSGEVSAWVFSGDLYLRLLDLYLEWVEADAERSLRLVLDVLVNLLNQGQRRSDQERTKNKVVDTLVSIFAGKSVKPLAKSAIMTLDRFLVKSVVSLGEVGSRYSELKGLGLPVSDLRLWEAFMDDILNWMRVPVVCPVAGKFVTTVYKGLRVESEKGFLAGGLDAQLFTVELWHKWLLDFLVRSGADPAFMEGVKNYIFAPLFKSDKAESLMLLEMMNRLDSDIVSPQIDMDLPATLKLAALEVGKRVGLIEEPGTLTSDIPSPLI